jgi:AcrR family transcriptional regulator
MVNAVYMAATDDSADTRARLLRFAREVYLEGGAAHFSLREVARRVGISAPAVYRHFDSKEALLGAVCEEGFRTFSSYLLRALTAETPLERLRSTGDYYLRFALDNAHDYRVIFMTDVTVLAGPEKKLTPRETSPTFQFLVDRVRECIVSRDLAKSDPTDMAATIWAHVHGLASLRLSGHLGSVGDDEAFAAFFRRSTDHLLAGFAP